MKYKFRHVFAFLISTTICGYALWQKMQTVAVVTTTFLLAIIYREKAIQVFNIFVDIINNARQAKVGNFELSIDRKYEEISKQFIEKEAWVQAVASQLSGAEISLLLAIFKAVKYPANGPIKDMLRILRRRGLILHDMDTLHDSTEVWLTPMGNDFAKALMEESNRNAAPTAKTSD